MVIQRVDLTLSLNRKPLPTITEVNLMQIKATSLCTFGVAQHVDLYCIFEQQAAANEHLHVRHLLPCNVPSGSPSALTSTVSLNRKPLPISNITKSSSCIYFLCKRTFWIVQRVDLYCVFEQEAAGLELADLVTPSPCGSCRQYMRKQYRHKQAVQTHKQYIHVQASHTHA